MIHHLKSQIPTETVLKTLRPGDMLTHLYHPYDDHAFDAHGAPIDALREARERGVILDVGHGVGSFVWRVAEPACREFGFWPDSISTDLHQFNLRGPVFDLPTTMSKFLYLGMPPEQIIRATTSVPARAMRVDERLGTLLPGRQADITLLKQEQGEFPLTDVEGVTRVSPQRLVPNSVCKRGKWSECGRYDSRTEAAQPRA
jgi:dihydroorotase